MEKIYKAEIEGKEFSIRTGKMAKQASGSVVVAYGGTTVLVTVVGSQRKMDIDFLPLSVEYQEKFYSVGRVPGNYFKREIGRPSEKETLTCRIIDRPIRPLFPKGYASETQVIASVLSMDKENEPDVLALCGASAALSISDIPFDGPIAGIRVIRKDGKFIANPTVTEVEGSDINIVVAGSKTGVIMVEGGASVVSEKDMIEAINFAHDAMQPIIAIQEEMQKAIGKAKREFVVEEKDQVLVEKVKAAGSELIRESLRVLDKIERRDAINDVKAKIIEAVNSDEEDRTDEIKAIFSSLLKEISRDVILKEGTRIDGRAFDEIRSISCETGVLERPHGSSLFTRGETQVLGVLTLGSGQDEQRVEMLTGESTNRFMLHYNFPPFSVGECRRPGGPSRRDIGHGTLALRAIEPVLPSKEDFEYTIRLISEVLESNGSSSMGTVCSGIMALMDGGVPIKAPVSGIAMGLVHSDENTVVLSDILGDEDHTGDMDFKVTGTKEGITALQMDIKIKELSPEIMTKALDQAKAGRLHILDEMIKAIDTHRTEISPFAPKVYAITINKDKIRDIIGPGGKTIRAIQADTNTRLEVDDSGIVKITAENQTDCDAAIAMVKDIGTDPEVGTVFDGKVTKTTDFGAFVNVKNGVDGLVHISELANYRVKKVTDIVKEGETLKVKILEVTRDGKIRLSHKATLTEEKE
ncbi:MAG: polyribonucleotide nucleotidyltransferase [Desulfobacterales bacterium]|nr:polyribonucleotide nucleotidyltransferase [Desulfobacterales bacterium]MCP4158829.1 polyribonucleotide nucleotidyltransferase [Deltaproteobacteria bacterium]